MRNRTRPHPQDNDSHSGTPRFFRFKNWVHLYRRDKKIV